MSQSGKSLFDSRRSLLKGGAALTGAAAAIAASKPLHALALDAPGDSLLSKIQDRGNLIVGTGSTNPPWHFEDEDGELVGFDIEMALIVAGGLFGMDHAQIMNGESRERVEFVVHEADARIPDLLADKVDVNFQFMTVTAGRALQAEFTIPYYREGVTVLLPADSEFNSLADMEGQGLTIAILSNVSAQDMVQRGIADATVDEYDSVAASIEALDSGRADGTAIDLSTGRWIVAQNPDQYKTVSEGWDPQTYAASVKPGDQIWLNWLNSAMHEAMVGLDFPLYQDAFLRYFGEELSPPPTGFPVEFK